MTFLQRIFLKTTSCNKILFLYYFLISNGLAPNRGKAITWISNYGIHRSIYASSGPLCTTPRHLSCIRFSIIKQRPSDDRPRLIMVIPLPIRRRFCEGRPRGHYRSSFGLTDCRENISSNFESTSTGIVSRIPVSKYIWMVCVHWHRCSESTK